MTYNQRGEVETVTNPAGQRTTLVRDDFGRITAAIEGDRKTAVLYDDEGRVKSGKTPDGQETAYRYDALGRTEAVVQNGVTVTRWLRDATGTVIGQEDALKRVTKYTRDDHDRILAEEKPNGSITRYEYDTLGRRTAQIDGNGNRIAFTYDPAGRLIKQVNPLGQTLTWLYNDRGRLKQRTNGEQTITYFYDEQGRPAKIDYGAPGQKILTQYNEKGRVKKLATAANSVTHYYDALGQVVARQYLRPNRERVLRSTYNSRGQKTSVTLSEKIPASHPGHPERSSAAGASGSGTQSKDPGATGKPAGPPAPQYRVLQQNEYTYDTLGHLTELKANGRPVCRYQYDATGRLLTRTFGNGITGQYAYDKFGRQTRLELQGGPLLEPLLLAYEWDPAGQLTRRTWNGEVQTYTYDGAGQLLTVSGSPARHPERSAALGAQSKDLTPPVPAPISASNRADPNTIPTLLESYKYDLAGNILEKVEHGVRTVMTYDTANQLVSSESNGVKTVFNYDRAGRLVSETTPRSPNSDLPSPSTKRLTYGLLDKVLTVARPDGTRIGFDYYPDGQLAAKAPLPTSPVVKNAPAKEEKKTGLALLADLISAKSEDADLAPNETQETLNANVQEELVWDGLALLWRNGTGYATEPHVSGGIPAASSPAPNAPLTFHLNDILGTTLAVVTPERVEILPMTAFGNPMKPVPPQSKPPAPSAPAPEAINQRSNTPKQP